MNTEIETKHKEAQQSTKPSREELMSRLPIPGPGAPKLTEEEKLKRRAMKEMVKAYIKDYEESFAEALPEISPVVIDRAKQGNMTAVQEIHKVLGAYKNTGGNVVVPVQINIGQILDDLENE